MSISFHNIGESSGGKMCKDREKSQFNSCTRLKVISLLVLAFLALPSTGHALVAITNGNYFTGFIDINHPTAGVGYQLKIERTYNSRSQYDGIFGYGWGTEFESFLIPAADGSVVIQESGGGEKTRFTPKAFDSGNMSKYVNELVKARQKKKVGFDIAQYKKKLLGDADYRDEQGRTLGLMPSLPVGTKLYSSQRGDKQVVTVIKKGFVRRYGDGRQNFFTTRGKVRDFGVDLRRRTLDGVYLITVYNDPIKKVKLTFKYDTSNGQLKSISDGKSQALFFKFDAKGKVIEVKNREGKVARYKYCKSARFSVAQKCGGGDLIESNDAAGNMYRFEYDNVHNLTKIVYADDTSEKITYWPPSPPGEGGTKSITTRTRVKIEYEYWADPKGRRMHFKTTVKTTFRSGRTTNASYEYWRKRRGDGSTYKNKMVTNINKKRTETTYNECCGQPLEIKSPAGVSRFAYYKASGLPKMKETPREVTRWAYHKKFRGKVTQVGVLKKGVINSKELIIDYRYNKKGNLLKARTNDGRAVALLYDQKGRIKTMLDQKKRKITFTYNRVSKPIEIRQEGVGSITVIYDGLGNIKEVKSKGGRQIALSVTAAFQNLLEIIKPAGVQPI